MKHTAEIFASSIVAVGAFNPAIFSSDWLEKNNLIGSQDADVIRNSESYVVTPQVCLLETDWFNLQILENQFSLTSKDALSPALRDLAVGILSLLPHTPVTALGLNFMGHFRMASEDEFFKFGDVLAPKQIWHELFPGENRSAGVGNLSIRIEPTKRGQVSETGNEIRISVQTSQKTKHGIFLSLNDHRVIRIEKGDALTLAECAAKIISDDWETVWANSVEVFDGLITKVLAELQEQAK